MKISKIHDSAYRPIGDLITYSPLPSSSLEQIDPFLFLNHHGPQTYGPNNNGLPFGPHPHRGMETVTFILKGDIMHKDSGGHQSVIEAGGVQWMTAGSGLIHEEISSPNFIRSGGELEILQLWINLPARLKMTKPSYKGLQKEDIPQIEIPGGILHLIAGKWNDQSGPFHTLTDIFMSKVDLNKNEKTVLEVPEGRNTFFYVVGGMLNVNGNGISSRQLVEFDSAGGEITIETAEKTTILFGHAKPLNEPMVAHGPFVMNSVEEIQKAYDDFRQGKFGSPEIV